MRKHNALGNGVAVVAALFFSVLLLLTIPLAPLVIVGLIALAGFTIISLDKSKKRDALDSNPQPEQQPLSTPKREAKLPPPPPPPPPPPFHQSSSATSQEKTDNDEAKERKEATAFPQSLSSGGKDVSSGGLLNENPAAALPPFSMEAGQLATHKECTPIPPDPKANDNDEPVNVVHAKPVASATFKVPRAPKNYGKGLWVPYGETITVKNTTIPGGMIYVGTSLKGGHGANDPCLIDPTKPVAQQGDYTQRQMGYWPSYSEISPSARRAYLNWLSGGRKDPSADIGFVFLFFYGLERRAIVDTTRDKSAKEDLPIITAELRQLLSIYGDKSKSFFSYASSFLDWIALPSYLSKLYKHPLPDLSKSSQLPLHLRLALGQAAMDREPVPSSLALAWIKLEQSITLRTPAIRCPEEFDQLFQVKYTELFNQGIVLPRNKTRLKLEYHPASAGFTTRDSLIKILEDVPDVTVLSAPIRGLQQVVEAATKDLEPFSRLLAKNPTARDTPEGLLRLPTALWPEGSKKRLLQLRDRVGEGMLSMKYEEAVCALFEEASASKDSAVPLARILESVCVGIEPNLLLGAKAPKPDDYVVLFAMPATEVPTHSDGPFLVAELTLQLASAVAAADGDFSKGEVDYLRGQVRLWGHLSEGQKRRLMAHIEFLSSAPVSLTPLKKKIEKLAIADRELIAESMARVAVADGDVSPDAIKVLERIYKVLGVGTSKVFSHLHGAASGPKASKPQGTVARVQEDRFTLNRDRIAAQQADTEKVQALLANIFNDSDESEAEILDDAPLPKPLPTGASSGMLLGLDQAHSTLARRMLERQEWSRKDLLQAAAELDLMLDGALERINDAAFDSFDMPFTEGDDPIVLNAEILGMLIT